MREGMPPPPRWCHLVWTTAGRRPLFKIAAVAGFCERTVRAECKTLGWTADTVTIAADQVHALIAVPPETPRQEVCRKLRRSVSHALRASSLSFPAHHLWEDPGWCAVLASSAAVTLVRHRLRAKANTPADASRP